MFSLAMGDVAVDGLVVCQQRLDPKNGSEDLQSYMWAVGGIAGIIGFISGGYIVRAGYGQECYYIMAA